MKARIRLLLAALLLGQWYCLPARGGPPFFTDDPEPVELGRHEFYLFSTLDHTRHSDLLTLPAFEYNAGVYPETQFHIVVPLVYSAAGGSSAYGLGDTELGLKYRFVKEGPASPQIGIFPMLEIATGDPGRGLGGGSTWLKLPLWLQKSWGDWTSYGGAGYAVNVPGKRNYFYGGWLVQRKLGERLTLGGELFTQQESGGIFNFGGYYDSTPDSSLLFTLGSSLSEADHYYAYLGFYRTW